MQTGKKRGFIIPALFIGGTLIIAGLFGYAAYSKYKQIKAEQKPEIQAPISNFPVDYKPADHSDAGVASANLDWQRYSDTKYGIGFRYPKEWGDVLPHDEDGTVYSKENVHVIRIATDNNKASNCIPFNTPKCKTSPDVEIFFQKGMNLMDKFIADNDAYAKNDNQASYHYSFVKAVTTIYGLKAVSYTTLAPMNNPENPIAPFGYFKSVLVGLQKPGGIFVEVAFTSPIFYTLPEAKSYSIADFDKFLSTIIFINPSTADTSNWKRYDPGKGFEIKYPPDWNGNAFSLNVDGVSFCPKEPRYGDCKNSFQSNNNVPIILTFSSGDSAVDGSIKKWYNPKTNYTFTLELRDKNYQDVYDQMVKTFTYL